MMCTILPSKAKRGKYGFSGKMKLPPHFRFFREMMTAGRISRFLREMMPAGRIFRFREMVTAGGTLFFPKKKAAGHPACHGSARPFYEEY